MRYMTAKYKIVTYFHAMYINISMIGQEQMHKYLHNVSNMYA